MPQNVTKPLYCIENATFGIQGDLLNIAMFFWHLVKRDFSSLLNFTVAYTSVTFHKASENQSHFNYI